MRPARIAAAVLALLSLLPFWLMLSHRPTGLAGMATAAAAADNSSLIWMGVLVAMIPALIGVTVLAPDALERWAARAIAPLARPRPLPYATLLAVLAFGAAAFVAALMQAPVLIDSFAQLTQARYLAEGALAAPVHPLQQFWHIQQTAISAGGWVSQYPPGYPTLLAAGFMVGAVWLVGPLMFALAAFFTSLIAERVFGNRALGRIAALLAALSPFMLGQAGAYMSHVAAAAFVAGALYFTLRAGERLRWAAAAGICTGALFAIRPLTAVAIGIVALLYTRAVRPSAVAIAAALPFALVVAWYNARFFGSPLTFGYTAALGPDAGLGFGIDPWGNRYGILDALAYTSAELVALSVHLLETPLPLLLLVGMHFAISPQPPRLTLIFWACFALVFANFFYWHHGHFYGPRMLADTGPLWVLLVVYSVVGMIARVRADWSIGRYNVRAFATGGAIAALAFGFLMLAPQRILSYRPSADVLARTTAPRIEQPAIVFVHGGWTARIAARLAAHGMRLDSVETALRQNSTCAAHKFSLAYAQKTGTNPQLDFAPRAVNLPPLVEISPGNRIRLPRGEQLDPECLREALADTAGVVDVTPFVWQGALPRLTPLADRDAMFARDMGPDENARLIESFPNRSLLAMTIDSDGRQRLQPYDSMIASRWIAR